jgi:hypothetical protein
MISGYHVWPRSPALSLSRYNCRLLQEGSINPLNKHFEEQMLFAIHHQVLLMWGLHYILFDLVSSLDRMYGLQILVDFSLYFITLTYGIYFCIWCVAQLHIQSDVTESAGVTRAFSISVVWLSLETIRLVAIAASCNTANTEANYTNHIPQRILLEPERHPYTVRQAKLFLQQVTKWPLHFTDWGFFNINDTALGTLMCSVTTYVFFLL